MKSNKKKKIQSPNKGEKIRSANIFPVVGIGASAGGLDAFKKLLKAIPENSGMAYVLVQHLDPSHESMLPDLLQKVTTIPVLEIADDIRVEPNHIYVIPSNKMMVANDGVLQLTPRPALNKTKRNLPIDLFFTSLAEVHQAHAIGVVLSGTASDGTAGLKAIKDHGGITFAQDEESAAFEGMPNSAVQSGAVDFVLPPDQIPLKILEVNKTLGHESDESALLQDDEVLRQIISLLRIRKGTDFTYYKQTTIGRRVLRRMALSKIEEPVDYLNYLRENKPEQDILYQDLLIPVTSFFRDEKSFDHLQDTVIPILVKSKTEGSPVRVWVAGCSTGEEAYSIAICFKEFFGKLQRSVQVFASDISEPAIEKARMGIYSKNELTGLSDLRLKESFTKTSGGYLVNKSLREMCVFAVHNFLKDPPFGKMDLITCRNVLIYMGPYLQKKALTTFHYALNPKGFLLLGKTETTNSVPDLFALASKHDKLYTRKDVPGRFVHNISGRGTQNRSQADPSGSKVESTRTDFQKTADEIVLSKYTPAGVVINDSMDIVHFRGNTSNYLEQTTGKPSHNLLKLAKKGLAFELRNLIHKAKKEKKAVINAKIPFPLTDKSQCISIEVIPLPNTIEPYYLILFHDITFPQKTGKKKPSSAKEKKDAKDLRIEQLEKELVQIHEDMHSIAEEQEASNEELQSDNEELLSSSEELQSLNEELETSKEELQSTNEELTVVNQEIVNLNEQVTDSLHYSDAIIGTIREPLLVLDQHLKVKTANSSYYQLFQVQKPETEGEFIYTVNNSQWDIPALRRLLEKILPEKTTFKDFEITQTFPTIGERIMLLNAIELRKQSSSEKLILLAMEDITVRRHLEIKETELRKRIDGNTFMIENMLLTAPAAISTLVGPDHVYELVNEQYQQLFGKRQLKGLSILKALPELVSQGIDLILDNVYTTGKSYTGTDIPISLARDVDQATELRYFNFSYQPMYDENKKIFSILVFGYEVTALVLAKNLKEELDQKYTHELEEKVKLRTEELSVANHELLLNNDELVKMIKELESFTYVASHDLQEPLRKIQTFANRLLNKETEHLSETGKDYFARMQKAAMRMQQLITDLLAFSRISTSDRKFEKTNLNLIVDDVKNDFNEIIEEKKATLEASGLGDVSTIKFQFRQVMQNLIGNALKFSTPGRAPHITIKSENVAGAKLNRVQADLLSDQTGLPLNKLDPEIIYCHITVSDNGIGFEPKYKSQIFELFQRLHGKEAFAGTGIGLSIVKKIVENHKGFVTASSELDKGSTFHVYLPAN